jgi:hypothetical protein
MFTGLILSNVNDMKPATMFVQDYNYDDTIYKGEKIKQLRICLFIVKVHKKITQEEKTSWETPWDRKPSQV